MSCDDVLHAVCEVIRAETGHRGPLDADTHLVDQLGLDSLGLLSITVALENRFELCLEPEGDEPLLRVGEVARLLLRMQAEAGERAA